MLDGPLRKQLLTFLVAGAGFSGVESVPSSTISCCARRRRNFHLDPTQIRVILVHSQDRILDREMPESLGLYAQRVLGKRGVEFIFGRRLQTATPEFAVLQDGTRIPTRTLVSTVPSSPNPLVASLDVAQERGRIKTGLNMQIEGFDDVWSLGDCALIQNPSGEGFLFTNVQFANPSGGYMRRQYCGLDRWSSTQRISIHRTWQDCGTAITERLRNCSTASICTDSWRGCSVVRRTGASCRAWIAKSKLVRPGY